MVAKPSNAKINVDTLSRDEAAAMIQALAAKFDVAIEGNPSMLPNTEVVDEDTGQGVKVEGGTRKLRVYRRPSGQPTWLPEDQYFEMYAKKRVVDMTKRGRGRLGVLTGEPLFSLTPIPGARQASLAKRDICPYAGCGKPMFNDTTNQTVVYNHKKYRVTSLQKHIRGHHTKSQEAIDLEASFDARDASTQASAIAAAVREAMQVPV